MALPEQSPMSKRRLQGTRFYVLRNYYALAAIGGFSLISIPIIYFSNFMKNYEALLKSLEGPQRFIETKRYHLQNHLPSSSKNKAAFNFRLGLENMEINDPDRYDHILKDDKPGIDDI
ncbi:hypothetical protein FHG87_004801 [Trinorchestia longiramus]|nr:hypothetical protein FHG87_004801 [Trinorchestia longiramus]